jgi:hypothetical protein
MQNQYEAEDRCHCRTRRRDFARYPPFRLSSLGMQKTSSLWRRRGDSRYHGVARMVLRPVLLFREQRQCVAAQQMFFRVIGIGGRTPGSLTFQKVTRLNAQVLRVRWQKAPTSFIYQNCGRRKKPVRLHLPMVIVNIIILRKSGELAGLVMSQT